MHLTCGFRWEGMDTTSQSQLRPSKTVADQPFLFLPWIKLRPLKVQLKSTDISLRCHSCVKFVSYSCHIGIVLIILCYNFSKIVCITVLYPYWYLCFLGFAYWFFELKEWDFEVKKKKGQYYIQLTREALLSVD